MAYDAIFTKDPDDVLDYSRVWILDGDTIATSTWIVPTGITVGTGGKAPTHDTTSTTVWLSGGTAHTSYIVTNRITTASGRTIDRSWLITVSEQ